MAGSEEAVILHLSDLQFGVHHRFTGAPLSPDDPSVEPHWRYANDQDFEMLATKLDEDLRILESSEGLKPNILVISGDVSEWSMEDEYQKAETFVRHLLESQYTDLSPERLVLVPGNHDVNWSLCESYFLECMAHRRTPQLPYTRKFDFWYAFLRRLFPDNGPYTSGLWHPWDLRDLGVLVLGLNSCVRESHRDNDHYGWLGRQQVKEAMEWVESEDPDHAYARVAVMHHNLVRGSTNDEENLRDWDEVSGLLTRFVDVVLHGHRHEMFRQRLGNLEGDELLVFGAGSAGLDSNTLPTCPNQYQIVRIKGEQGHLFLRSYNESATDPNGGRGVFRPDADPLGKWRYPLTLTRVRKAESKGDGDLDRDIDFSSLRAQLLESVANSVQTRLNREREKIGAFVQLHCRDVRDQSVSSVMDRFREWLKRDLHQMVILGASGSGKTVSCLEFCREILESHQASSWVPLYVDLGRFCGVDDALEIIGESFRHHGLSLTVEELTAFLKSHQMIFLLDSFDEYERSDIVRASDRPFENFGHFAGPNIKIVVSCRSNFFRRPEDVLIYELRSKEFELCPGSAVVVELLPLDPTVVSSILAAHLASQPPDWVSTLVDRPLYLRMLIPLLRAHAIDLSRSMHRHELYEQFITYVLNWDCVSRPKAGVSLAQSRAFHVALAERFLEKGEASLPEVDLSYVVESAFDCGRTDEHFVQLLFFFQQSGLLRFEGGRIVFSHKSYREYLAAKRIVDLIAVQDDSFEFIWFTRNEREFIVEMLGAQEKETLLRWLGNETRYPACNYASFILGGTREKRFIRQLRERLEGTSDALVKVNCANALAGLGDDSIVTTLWGMVTGYLLEEGLVTVQPVGADSHGIGLAAEIASRFGRNVMLIHLCESIDALAMCGDERAVDVMRQLEQAGDKAVAEEARGAVRRLLNRLAEESGGRKETGRRGSWN